MTLAEETAVQIKPDTSPLSGQEAETLADETPHWSLKKDSIERVFDFKDFREAVDFVNDVADVADTQNHHPDIDIRYNKVKLVLSTHRIGGLTRNDFILAAKIDHLV
jgi:4a-hydroxytetrahydrobiopterin dehydratase